MVSIPGAGGGQYRSGADDEKMEHGVACLTCKLAHAREAAASIAD